MRLRPTFGTKLLLALLGTIAIVLAVMLVVVRRETANQVEWVAQRAMVQSRRVFHEVEELQRLQLERLGNAFTESPRTMAAVEAAQDGSDIRWLAETARYELALRMTPHYLAAFTDPNGRPLLTMLDGRQLQGDPAALQPLVRQLTQSGAPQELAYRNVGGHLYLLQVQPVGVADVVGTVVFGLPMDDEAARRIGQVLGAEVCFITGGRCVAGTGGARGPLGPALVAGAGARHTAMISRLGQRWQIIGDSVSTARAGETWRVMALPMDPVLAPFDRIRKALELAGALTLALAAVLGIALARGLTRPVRELSDATARVARGDYTAHVPVRSRDELGSLAQSFNEMAEGLLLKERYRGVLDKVVSPEVAEDLLKGEIRLGGENRQITTVFADIVSFTALVEGMEPQGVIGLLNECMERLEACVQAEGGIVDKYVGDAIMAVFGAPVSHPDDAARAVRSATRMQDAMRALNAERGLRGERPLHLAIGVHAGVAVAGNMGSPNRLNYTVLGDAVNLASRLCGAAGAGEILLSEETYERVRDVVPGRALGALRFKGFSSPVPVYAVNAGPDAVSTAPPVAAQAGAAPIIRLLLLAALASFPLARSLLAQEGGGLPTLAGLGLAYQSKGGGLQVDLSGRLDLEEYVPRHPPVGLIPTGDAFTAGRLRLLTDIFVGPRVYSLLELRADRGEAPSAGSLQARVEQVFLRVKPLPKLPVQVQAGKFALPFGSYVARHHTDADPFIRPPLPYDYRTIVSPTSLPAAIAGFMTWQDDPARRPPGAPPIWAVPYPWGAMLLGGRGPLSLRLAAVGSAPSSAPADWRPDGGRLGHPSIVAGATLKVAPELSVGASFDNGPYLAPKPAGTLPAGTTTSSFHQRIWGADATFTRGRAALRGEAFLNRWQVPNLPEDPGEVSYYVEGSVKPVAGVFLAARWGQILFDRMSAPPAYTDVAWDHDARRIELGAGYRLVRNAEVRAEYLVTNSIRSDRLFALSCWWAF